MGLLIRLVIGLIALGLILAVVAWRVLVPPAPLPPPRPGATLEGVVLIEPGLSRRLDQRIEVSAEGIVALGPSDGSGSADYRGAYVLPSLIDLHAHLPPSTLLRDGEFHALLYLDLIRKATDWPQRGVKVARKT